MAHFCDHIGRKSGTVFQRQSDVHRLYTIKVFFHRNHVTKMVLMLAYNTTWITSRNDV